MVAGSPEVNAGQMASNQWMFVGHRRSRDLGRERNVEQPRPTHTVRVCGGSMKTQKRNTAMLLVILFCSVLTLQCCTRCIFNKRMNELEVKYSLESTDPRESEIRAHLRP